MLRDYIKTRIASGTTTDAIDMGSGTFVGFQLNTDITSTSATFLVAVDGENFQPMYKPDGTAYSVTIPATATGYYAIDNVALFSGFKHFKIVFGSSETDLDVLIAVRGIE